MVRWVRGSRAVRLLPSRSGGFVGAAQKGCVLSRLSGLEVEGEWSMDRAKEGRGMGVGAGAR